MTTKTNFKGIMEVQELWNTQFVKGFVSATTVKKVAEILELEERTDMELQNLRDFTVMYFDGIASDARRDGDWDLFDKCKDCSSAVVSIIDTEMMM